MKECSTMNDPEIVEWLASDAGHRWMDGMQISHRHGNYQAVMIPFGNHGSSAPRYGWEYGLFGFKKITEISAPMHHIASGEPGDALL
jgi:hypothetical protein